MGVVLDEELLIGFRAGAVSLRIAPTVEEVAPFAPAPARVPRRLGLGGAMVDNPDFTQVMNTHR